MTKKPERNSDKKAERSVKKATSARSAQTGQYSKSVSPIQGRSVGHVRLAGGTKKGYGTDRTPSRRDAAPSPPVNQAAIALLRSWRKEDPEQQRKDWEALKQVLEEDRPSDRKLFP